MTIYNLDSEPVLTAPDDADIIPIMDMSAKAIKQITLANLKQEIIGGAPVALTASTVALDRATHAGRVCTLNRAAGIDLTLPAATGSGDRYEFVILTDTTDLYAIVINPTPGTDVIAGHALADDGDGEPANGWSSKTAVAASFGGASQASGGSRGDRIVVTDVASGIWQLSAWLTNGGTEATPFS